MNCVAVEMHKSLPRCFLNSACSTQAPSDDYDVLYRVAGDNERLRRRRLAQSLIETVDMSTRSVLRFPRMKFAAGAYKLCFCEVDVVEGGVGAPATPGGSAPSSPG